MNLQQNSCMTCMHRHEHQCRRYPPHVTAIVVPEKTAMGGLQPRVQYAAAFPQAEEGLWCGEWAAEFKAAH